MPSGAELSEPPLNVADPFTPIGGERNVGAAGVPPARSVRLVNWPPLANSNSQKVPVRIVNLAFGRQPVKSCMTPSRICRAVTLGCGSGEAVIHFVPLSRLMVVAVV